MHAKGDLELGAVQRTLLLPLWGRAVESQKPDPLLVDRKAVEIVEALDFDFAALARTMNELSRLAWIMRARAVDRIVDALLERRPAATIANLGCGLDTTFERIDNGQVRWFDLDLPDVVALRSRFISDGPRRKTIAASLLEEGWLAEVGECDLFIAAGLFYYFEEGQIRSFLRRLADRFAGATVLFDACSPTGMRTANRLVIRSAGLDERSFLKWGLSHTRDLLGWDERFRLLETIYYFKGKKLPGSLRLAGSISDLLRIQYMIHLSLG